MNSPIPHEASRIAYEQARLYYDKKISNKDAVARIPMKASTARMFINAYRAMRGGQVYKNTINTYATRYFLEGIHREQGDAGLIKALAAVEQHIPYYHQHRNAWLREIQDLHQEFSARLTTSPAPTATYGGASQPRNKHPSKTRVQIELAGTRPDEPPTVREEAFLHMVYEHHGMEAFERGNWDAGSLRSAMAKNYMHYITGDPASLQCVFRLSEKYSTLRGQTESNLFQDIEVIQQKINLLPVEKQRLIDARLGQGKFRADVARIEKQCRVTGLMNLSLLTASHIKPWSECGEGEHLDGYNGLLLSPHIDRLFDRGHLSFEDNGDMLLSGAAKEAFRHWGITPRNVGAFHPKQAAYLRLHRKKRVV